MADEAKVAETAGKEKAKRRTYRNDDWTEEQVAAKKAELTVEAAPEGWIKLSEASDAMRANGIPVSKFVRAFGGDRGMNPPISPEFKFVYVGRTRYVPPEVLTTGIAKLKDPSFMKTTRTPKAKKEKAESGPVADAKKEPQGRRVAVRPGS